MSRLTGRKTSTKARTCSGRVTCRSPRIGSTAVTTPNPAVPIAARSGAGLAKRDIKGESPVPRWVRSSP